MDEGALWYYHDTTVYRFLFRKRTFELSSILLNLTAQIRPFTLMLHEDVKRFSRIGIFGFLRKYKKIG